MRCRTEIAEHTLQNRRFTGVRIRRMLVAHRWVYGTVIPALLLSTPAVVEAQATIHPRSTTPAAWERFAIRVVSGTDTPTVAVRVRVPDAVTVLGVDAPQGWSSRTGRDRDDAPQVVVWSGGTLLRGTFREFAFLGRVRGDARQTDLVFPVTLTRADGSTWEDRELRVRVTGRTRLSVRGVTAIAGTAVGMAVIALVVAIAAGRRRSA